MNEIKCNMEDMLNETSRELKYLKEKCINGEGDIDIFKKMAVLETSRKLMERAVPKAIKEVVRFKPYHNDEVVTGSCPVCYGVLQEKTNQIRNGCYCRRCGQFLKLEA